MAGFIRALAVDLDGTLTEHDRVSQAALQAIDAVRDDGLAVVLVTGRILAELEATFPGLVESFDAVVAENGAVLEIDGDVRRLGDPVEEELVTALAEQGVGLRRGSVLLAGDARDARAVVDAVGALGLDCQIVRNRGALMVLPAGVSKGTGMLAALHELGISPHNALAIGDAENDLSLLHAAEIGVAVGNAVPSLRDHADLVLDHPDGKGVGAFLRGPVRRGVHPVQPPRRRLAVGRFDDGSTATVPGLGANILVCGESGAGKSYVAGLLVEEWVGAGYAVLLFDMEGDHTALRQLHNTVVLDGRPSAEELLTVLRQGSLSVVLDVSMLAPVERMEYLATLPPLVEAERAAWGLPHWIVVDEAHVTLSDHGVAADVFRPADRGYCLVTFHPEQLCAEALAAIDVTITVTPPPLVSAGWPARAPQNATLRETGSPARPFAVGLRRTPHVRHRRKYAVTDLPQHRWFVFQDGRGHAVGSASDLAAFSRLLRTVDTAVLAHHLERGDFSRWMVGTIQDRDLAAAVGAIERNLLARRATDVLHARERLIDEVDSRYLTGT